MRYNVGENVVFKYDDHYEVGLVTSVRAKKGKVLGYDIRSEKGSGHLLVRFGKDDITLSQHSGCCGSPVIVVRYRQHRSYPMCLTTFCTQVLPALEIRVCLTVWRSLAFKGNSHSDDTGGAGQRKNTMRSWPSSRQQTGLLSSTRQHG